MDTTGITPVYNMNGNDANGFGGGCGWWFWIIILFFFWGGNGAWGNQGGASAATEYGIAANGVSDEFIKRDLFGINQNVSNQGFDTQKEILESRYTNQLGLQQVTGAVTQAQFASQLGQQNLQAQIQGCCCDLKGAIHEEGEATRALINAQAMQDLRDRLADRDRELQAATFQISQQTQNATIINALKPQPIPAYLTASPYTAYPLPVPTSGCGCGCQGTL